MVAEPSAGDSVIGEYGFHNVIEGSGVVHFFPVGQLVNDHVVKDRFGRENETPVEVEITGAAAAAPAGLLLTDGYAAICNAHDPGIVSSLLCEDRTGGLHVETALLPGQSGPFFGRMESDLFQVSENPVFSGMKERVDKGTGTSVRGAHRDLAVAAYLYGGCFPAAVYDLVCKWKLHVITSKTSVT